ncbi:MAG: hypothetical protein AAEI92_07570 [Arenicellales bacterium]|jgi:hypothetical protein
MIARDNDSPGHGVHIPAPSTHYKVPAMARYQQACLEQDKGLMRKTRASSSIVRQ